jgi:hypothetical protein
MEVRYRETAVGNTKGKLGLLRLVVILVEAEVACSCTQDKKRVCHFRRLYRMLNLYSSRTRRLCRTGTLVQPGMQVTSRLYYVIM